MGGEAEYSTGVEGAPTNEPGGGGRACNAWTPGLAKTPAYMAETTHLLLMIALVVGQGVMHYPEHIAQVIQLEVLQIAPVGLLGVFNLEWVHLIYNMGLLAIMVPILVGCGFFARNNAWRRANPMAWNAMMAAFWIQVIHVPEHYAKVSQLLMTGQQGTPGLIGYYVAQIAGEPGVVWFHFWINIVVLAPLVYVLYAYDVLGALRERIFPEGPSA